MYDTVIDFATVDGITVASIASEIDVSNAETIGRYLDEAIGASRALVVSLARCTYIDSSGLRPLIALAMRLGAGLHVVVPYGTQVRRVFEITGLAERIHLCATLDEAIASATKGLTAA